MRQLGWTDIEMTELSHKRIEIRREKLSLEETRGAHASPSNVEEAVSRLRDVEGRFRSFHEKSIKLKRQDSKAKNQDETRQRKLFKEGNLTHKSESELRTHTSYLVFAVLTQEWSENDERTAQGV
jgi:tRNA (adenine57-N1/adenine58-N1)-methyltransferase